MNLEQLRAFLTVADRRSFTAAGKALGVTKQTVSRRVAELEESLGVSLLLRSTRSVSLTPDGEVFAREVRRGLDGIEEGLHKLEKHADDPADEIWIGAPALFARRFLSPVVHGLLRELTRLRVAVCALGAADALDFDHLDVIITVGPLPDLSVKRIPLGDAVNGCFASPAYLEAQGRPRDPAALTEHACLSYSRRRGADEWTLRRREKSVRTPVRVRFRSNDAKCVLEAAIAGMGIALLPLFLCREAVAAGQLVRVLPRWERRLGKIAALYRETRAPRPGLDRVLDAIREQLTADRIGL